MIRNKIAAASLVVAGLVGLAAGPALADDCYVASRSAKGGTQAAANSGVWVSIPEALRMFVGLDDQQISDVMAVVNDDTRIPAGFAIYVNPNHEGELAWPISDTLATNGKGIDHSFDNGVLLALFQDIQTATGISI